MKKIFLLLILFLSFSFLRVNAMQLGVPTYCFDHNESTFPTTCGTSTRGNWANNQIYASGNFYIIPNGPSLKQVNYIWDNANLCSGQNLVISGKFHGLLNPNNRGLFEKYPLGEFALWSNGQKMSCTTTKESGLTYRFSCTGSGGGTLVMNIFPSNYDIVYDDIITFGVDQDLKVSCDPTNADIIDSQNQNTQHIIDNQNSNQQQTNQKLDEAENTRKGILGKIGDLFTSVVELPGKLVNLLIDALKSLFVPTDDQLLEIINDSKELTENFGFVGESMNFFINIFTSLLGMTNQRGCLELPEFTLPLSKTGLADDVVFWKAQNVCLADNPILSENIDTIRSITSIVLVGLFIGFASSKFFTILSKNDVANDVSGVSWEQDGDEVYRTEYWRRGTNSFSKRSRYR